MATNNKFEEVTKLLKQNKDALDSIFDDISTLQSDFDDLSGRTEKEMNKLVDCISQIDDIQCTINDMNHEEEEEE